MASNHTLSSSTATFPGVMPTVAPAAARPGTTGAAESEMAAVYLRRRVAIIGAFLAVAIALVGVFGLIGDAAGADDGTFSYDEPTLYIVQPGDTLWSIAVGFDADADPRALVDELEEVAGSSSLQIGQRLLIPARIAG